MRFLSSTCILGGGRLKGHCIWGVNGTTSLNAKLITHFITPSVLLAMHHAIGRVTTTLIVVNHGKLAWIRYILKRETSDVELRSFSPSVAMYRNFICSATEVGFQTWRCHNHSAMYVGVLLLTMEKLFTFVCLVRRGCDVSFLAMLSSVLYAQYIWIFRNQTCMHNG